MFLPQWSEAPVGIPHATRDGTAGYNEPSRRTGNPLRERNKSVSPMQHFEPGIDAALQKAASWRHFPPPQREHDLCWFMGARHQQTILGGSGVRIRSLVTLALLGGVLRVGAQEPQDTARIASPMDPASMLANAQRPAVTRAELRATLDTLQDLLQSPGYSQALRSAKQAEADAIKERLTDGDLHTGDVIAMQVTGDSQLTGTYPVTARRTIIIPGGAEIPVKGVLRSELQDYLTAQLKQYIRNPIVQVASGIRVWMHGAIGTPGFYNVSATSLLSGAIQDQGGHPTNDARLNKSQIRRAGRVVVDGQEFATAIRDGSTLDELNVEAGDEIYVASKPAGGTFFRILGGVGAVASVVWIALRVF
jgi:protein involved in polysaccharide export with SLBB domain